MTATTSLDDPKVNMEADAGSSPSWHTSNDNGLEAMAVTCSGAHGRHGLEAAAGTGGVRGRRAPRAGTRVSVGIVRLVVVVVEPHLFLLVQLPGVAPELARPEDRTHAVKPEDIS